MTSIGPMVTWFSGLSRLSPAPTSQTVIEMVIVWDTKITWGIDLDHDLFLIEGV
ncbi:hypothetical protein ABZX93_14860 [Streptomyces sp. NPDC006632]|uniref:hypothetical protein n=1 Tax=Streptomyces sp. NPDC006632 TaxID=3157182 RepID=UPI0033AF0B0C